MFVKKILLLIMPSIILCQIIINSESKDYCPDRVGSKSRMPRLQIRSVLVRCPNKGEFHVVKAGVDERTNLSITRTQDLLEFFGYDTDEPLLHSEVTSCRRKLVVTIQMANCGKTKTEEEFILIDQVYDPIWKQRIRLLNPMVFKIKQHQVEQAFGLNIQHIVNAEAKEEVLSKNNLSFKGCETNGLNPTCGYSYYHDEVIPYSEGFCCSCDPYINVRRQPDSFRTPPLSPIAFTSREGQFPQGFPEKMKKMKNEYRKRKRNIKRSLKEAMDEIYLNFATKIKSYMMPPARTANELRNNNQPGWRAPRGLMRHSYKYYNIPPLQPAKGFKVSEMKDTAKNDFDPWAIAVAMNDRNQSCPPDKSLRNCSRECRRSDDGSMPYPLLSRLFDANSVRNNSQALVNILGLDDSEAKRSIFTHYYDPGAALSKLLSQPSNMPLNPDSHYSSEYFIKKSKETKENDWVNRIVNPYMDFGQCSNGQEATSAKSAKCKDANAQTEAATLVKICKNDQRLTTTPAAASCNHPSSESPRLKLIKTLRRKHHRGKRQITASGAQIRGGQSCVDRHTPPHVNPETYHESAHCLRFSELWYNVYRLKTPFVSHKTDFQLFEKHTFEAGNSHWEDLTKGLRIQLGTFARHVTNSETDPTLVFTYTPLTDIQKNEFCLDPMKTTMLVPRPLPKSKEHLYPQISGGPREYLLVRAEDITFDGEECDKAGVSYRAFAKQLGRCDHVRGTCLDNQPLQLWRHDKKAQKVGLPGKYFLENYAHISDEPVKFHKEIGDFLSLDFTGSYLSVVEVEVPIDRNGLVRAESSAQISEIYIDATCVHQTRITVLVTNTGLTSSAFYPRMKGCPPEIPLVWTENEGPLVYIAPQKVHKYRLSLYGRLPVSRFHCSIEVMNKKKELVATRRIRIQTFDRCICMWHCLCACIGSVSGLKCQHMSLEHFHAAGFSGALPVDTEDPTYEAEEKLVPTPFVLDEYLLYMAQVYAALLFTGFLKFLLGLLCTPVFNYGIWILFESEAKHFTKYKESYWSLTNLVRDDQCFPVSPAGKSRNIQILSRPAQSIVNILFFCIAPGVVLLKLPRAICSMCCMMLLLLKDELLKYGWMQKLSKGACCQVFGRCLRRMRRSWNKNCLIPICCCLNPFFIYSLCKKKTPGDGMTQQKGKVIINPNRICKMHKLPMKEKSSPSGGSPQGGGAKISYCNYVLDTPQGLPERIGELNTFLNGTTMSKKTTMPKIRRSYTKPLMERLNGKGDFDMKQEVEQHVGCYVIKAQDYPNLDKKAIKYVVKNMKKGFNSVIRQVIKTYKTQRQKKDSNTVYNICENLKNKLLRDVVITVTKQTISDIVKRKCETNYSTSYNKKETHLEKVPVKPMAEQIMVLTENCFKEFIRRKLEIPTRISDKDNNRDVNVDHTRQAFSDFPDRKNVLFTNKIDGAVAHRSGKF